MNRHKNDMTHDESLVFHILHLLDRWRNHMLDERRLVHEIVRQSHGAYDSTVVQDHLQHMQKQGLVKSHSANGGHTLYQLGWAGYDYLDES